MANINDVKERVEHLANKNGYNSYISPDEFNSAFASAERRLYSMRYNEFLRNEKNADSLAVHMSDPTPITIPTTGKYVLGGDVHHINAISKVLPDGKTWPVERVEADRVANRLNSEYDAPDSQFPIYTRYSDFLQFYPVNLASATMVYLKELIPSLWDYTVVGRRAVYKADTSVQPLWNDDDIDKLIYMVLSDIGIQMADPNIVQFSERKIVGEQ